MPKCDICGINGCDGNHETDMEARDRAVKEITEAQKPEAEASNSTQWLNGKNYELVQLHECGNYAEVVVRDKNGREVYAGNITKVKNPNSYY
jgi:hypothetical protein